MVEVRESAISARFFSEDPRVQIADLRKTGAGIRQIATAMGKSTSTVSLELRRIG
ncbi:helix-turn-helix domain-containing protein [Rhodococcus qingshengii]|uniref:helix-turn-helix domain-containing protein n=1 Tax=Rhodococcus qingshengii TaxID=334542 RepID=UPI001C24C0F8|nr:helix-turn-helix domain-containing protein [Rhodococcus qingshengii]